MSVVWDLALPQVCGLGLHLCLDGFRLVYICIAILMWTVSGVFSKEYMAHYKNHGLLLRRQWECSYPLICTLLLSFLRLCLLPLMYGWPLTSAGKA